jgi:hypothetical protein
MMPSRTAYAAASARPWTSILRQVFTRCRSIAWIVTPSRCATWAFVSPRTTQPSTSRPRAVRMLGRTIGRRSLTAGALRWLGPNDGQPLDGKLERDRGIPNLVWRHVALQHGQPPVGHALVKRRVVVVRPDARTKPSRFQGQAGVYFARRRHTRSATANRATRLRPKLAHQTQTAPMTKRSRSVK